MAKRLGLILVFHRLRPSMKHRGWDLHFLTWWSEPMPAIRSEGLAKDPYQKNIPPTVRFEPAIYRLQTRLFTNWAILNRWIGIERIISTHLKNLLNPLHLLLRVTVSVIRTEILFLLWQTETIQIHLMTHSMTVTWTGYWFSHLGITPLCGLHRISLGESGLVRSDFFRVGRAGPLWFSRSGSMSMVCCKGKKR